MNKKIAKENINIEIKNIKKEDQDQIRDKKVLHREVFITKKKKKKKSLSFPPLQIFLFNYLKN